MSSPLVSVILPNYNHARFLDQRIQSILNQSYSNFELIILDDNSSDNSVEVINKYKRNPHITNIIINKENSGSTFIQWNRGITLANGEILWIAESDDYCDVDFLKTCVGEYLKTPDCVVTYCSSEYVDAQNNDLGTFNHYSKRIYRAAGRDFIKERMAYGCAIWNASSAIFRKKTALEIDKQYEQFKACGDKLFWIEMFEKGNVCHINKTLNYFRQHRNKVSPKRFIDGTSLKEERLIFKYQLDNGYINGFKRIFIESLFLNRILYSSFLNESIKKDLLRLWKFNNSIRRNYIKWIGRLYQYYNIYILRRKPI